MTVVETAKVNCYSRQIMVGEMTVVERSGIRNDMVSITIAF